MPYNSAREPGFETYARPWCIPFADRGQPVLFMDISIVVAVAENGVIGRGGTLPWRLADDLRRFKSLTMGHAIIMGRRTWESIGRALPGRRTVVVSRQSEYQPGVDAVDVAGDLASAFAIAEQRGETEAFVVGGAEVYREALMLADRLYLTRVHAAVEGDTFFPEFVGEEWRKVESSRHQADQRNDHPFSFEVYERVGGAHGNERADSL